MRQETREAWKGRIERWQHSGLTAGQFAAREGIRPQTLTWWRWRLGRERRTGVRRPRGASAATPPVEFVELVAAPATRREDDASSSVELVLGRSYRVRVAPGFDGEVLERVLDVLEARR